MRLLAGTSGFSYKEWKGPFYPEKLPQRRFLEYYAERLPTVEINNTFYRMPKPELLAGWAETVPDGFEFVLKASQRITHHRKLVDCTEPLEYLWEASEHLGEKRGPLLFQLPPYLRADLDVLRTFLDELPAGCRAAFEFRHESWFDEGVADVLKAAGQTLCQAETTPEEEDEDATTRPELVVTSEQTGYLRLRKESYADHEIEDWAQAIAAMPWRSVYVFFKHETTAPTSALRLSAAFDRLSEHS